MDSDYAKTMQIMIFENYFLRPGRKSSTILRPQGNLNNNDGRTSVSRVVGDESLISEGQKEYQRPESKTNVLQIGFGNERTNECL